MPSRREFLASVGVAALSTHWGLIETRASAAFDSTWLTYAPDLEQFWANLPFLGRLRKLAETGFSRYEFARWKTKDVDAIAKLNEELGLQAALFVGYPGLRAPRWKEGLLDAIGDAAELAPKLGAGKVSVVAGDRDEKIDRDEQVEQTVNAFKEAVEKVGEGETETILILEPGRTMANRPKPLLASVEEAAAVVKAVGSDRLKLGFPIDRVGVVEGKILASIEKHKDQTGHYRLIDFGPPLEVEGQYARVLKAIRDAGHQDPIGLSLAAKGDPIASIESIRKLDSMAKAL